jgi:hypothetical protein
MAVTHQSRLFQGAKMLRDGRLRDPGLGCNRPNRLLSGAAEPLEDRPTGGIGERLEKCIVSVFHLDP